ncbi:MAG: sugar transferase [Spirochaetes bacterium]|nr:sugar transferase [Spirochaetota bacterium]
MAMISRRLDQFVIFLVDIVLLYGSFFLALAVWEGAERALVPWAANAFAFAWIAALWVLVFYTAGLYVVDDPFDGTRFFKHFIVASAVAGLASFGLLRVVCGGIDVIRDASAVFPGIVAIIVWTWRFSYARIRRFFLPKVGVAFVGYNAGVAELASEMAARPHMGYEARLVYDPSGATPSCAGPECVAGRDAFVERAAVRDIGLVIIARSSAVDEDARKAVFGLLARPVRYLGLPEFYESFLRKVPIGDIDELWFLEKVDRNGTRPYAIAKRVTDILVATSAMLLSLPFWPLVALAIKLGSQGPVLFRQRRLGRFGKPFTILKFRTMRTDLNDFAPTGKDDPRVTAFGDFMRKSRIDEIPQMLNILMGEMSFVGPRPERPELAIELEKAIPFYRERLRVKPGITGWDQVSGEYHSPSVEDTYKKLQYDLYYIKNYSVFLDVSIFFKTIFTVFMRAGR